MYDLTTEHTAHYSHLQALVRDADERARLLRVPRALIRAIDGGKGHSRQALPPARARLLSITLDELSERLGSAEEACSFLMAGNHLSKLLQNGGRDHKHTMLKSAAA